MLRGYGLDSKLMEIFNKAYIGTADTRLPLISPSMASDVHLKQFPQTLIVNAEHDILLWQGTELAQRLSRLDISVHHTILSNAVHLFITVQGQPTAFKKAVKITADFLTTFPSDFHNYENKKSAISSD